MNHSITFPDRCKICEELLLGVEKRPIDIEIANIIYGHFQNKSSYFIEYEVWDDPRVEKPTSTILERPNLWRFDTYIKSSQVWKLQRNYSETLRIKEWIEKANCKMVRYHLVKAGLFDENAASAVAYRLVHKGMWKNIRALGITKQITKEEEL